MLPESYNNYMFLYDTIYPIESPNKKRKSYFGFRFSFN